MSEKFSTAVSESTAAIIAKAGPPASVSIATLFGVPVSDLVLWATLIYTVLLAGHKIAQIIGYVVLRIRGCK